VNGKSRTGQDWFPQVEQELRDGGLELAISKLHRDPSQVMPHIKEAIDKGIRLVCVGGGDGTLSGAAEHFINSESVMGVLPLGTGNSLARDLRIKINVKDACDTILNGREETIDVGEVNGATFLNVATIGLTALIAENLDDAAKKRFGRAVYLIAMIKALAKMRRFNAVIELPNGETHKFRSIQVVVGNGRFHAGPFPISPDASIESGYLSGYSVNTSRKGIFLKYLLSLWSGRNMDIPEVVPFHGTSLKITTQPYKRIVVDGEVKFKTPAECRILPGALKVMVPADAELGNEGGEEIRE
jgi:diacylglycerol kinase (ATP)